MKPKQTESEYTSEQEKRDASFQALFPKKKQKQATRKKKNAPPAKRYTPLASEGLSTAQVNERIEEGLVNNTQKKYSKSYLSIFMGNICTGFNLLCAIAAIALLLARAEITHFLFVAIFAINIAVGIVLEIRAKHKLDKLSILSSPTAKVVRNGRKSEILTKDILLDDVLILSAGQQVPADCIALEGTAELNESL